MSFETAFLALAAAAFLNAPLIAQSSTAATGSQAPATGTLPSGHPNNPYWVEHDQQLLGGLWRPRRTLSEADFHTAASGKPGEDRVVFMGDSITEGWKLNESFPGKPYINRGIGGQTTPQMLVRFRQDVIDLKPKVVRDPGRDQRHRGKHRADDARADRRITSRRWPRLARRTGFSVVLCSVLPAFDFSWSPGLQPAPKIVALNAWMKDYAAQKGYVYVDYYSAMKDERGGLPGALSKDGVHPAAGRIRNHGAAG